MQQFVIELPDEVAARLRQFADERHESPEESLRAFAEMELTTPHHPAEQASPAPIPPKNPPAIDDDYPDPWEGFHGAFQSPYPDLTSNHDFYIAAEAVDPHESPGNVEQSDERQ